MPTTHTPPPSTHSPQEGRTHNKHDNLYPDKDENSKATQTELEVPADEQSVPSTEQKYDGQE